MSSSCGNRADTKSVRPRLKDDVLDVEEDEAAGDGMQLGSRVPKKTPDPMLPTLPEIEEHNMTHLPYRAWCPHCVRGRGESHQHRRSPGEERTRPELSLDYCFIGKKDEKTQPIMVIRDRDTRMTCSFLVKEKGAADDYVIKRLMAFIKEVGYEAMPITLKSDQESAIKAVINKIILARSGQITMPEHSPVRSSGSNGVIERAIKEVEGQIRVMKSATDARVETDITGTSNTLPWMIEFASVLINRYLVGTDGKTAYERSRGKTSKMIGFEFGELVHFRRIPVHCRLGKLDSLWGQGLFIGYKSQSGEYMVANMDGAYKTRTIKRMPEPERWKKDLLENMPWTPWRIKNPTERNRTNEAEAMQHDPFLEIDVDKSIELPPPPKRDEDAMPRRVYLTKALLDKYGMTDGCIGCTASAAGGTGVVHSDDCRQRVEDKMKKDPEMRIKLKEVKSKQKNFIEKHANKHGARFTVNEDEKSDDDMQIETGTSGSGAQGEKRKAEGEPDDPSAPSQGDMTELASHRTGYDEMMNVMICLCEEVTVEEKEVHKVEAVTDQDDVNMGPEELSWSWADATAEEQDETHTLDKQVFHDEITGKVLKYEKVIEARLDEVKALIKMGVWEVTPLADCIKATGKKPIRGRWIDINKGDDLMEMYRSRYVVQEIRGHHGGAEREGLFAAMPPIEGLRMLISHVMSRKGQVGCPLKLMFIDISKAYLHADVIRDDIYVDLPLEMGIPHKCGRLRKALYGTREAAKCWEVEYCKTLAAMGFKRGRCNPCMFLHASRDLRVLVHGDDFTVSGCDADLHWLAELFQSKYKTKVRGILGPEDHDMKAITILNRILEWGHGRITLEADPRHDDIILKTLILEKAIGSDITGVKQEVQVADRVLGAREAT